ncbi:MAG: hypothetical protein Q8N09_03955, partial [Thermodesulfovibrionia bacterium]|nr:hypothetical protein [Thermodesulfovibrionia bacterium]
KLATYVCHSCESRNPEKPKKILDSRLIPAGMTDIELMQLNTSYVFLFFVLSIDGNMFIRPSHLNFLNSYL